MKINSLKYIMLLMAAFIMGCDAFLDVDIPKDQLNTQKVFTDDRTATSALTNVYSNMRKAGFLSGSANGAGYLLGCYADETEAMDAESSDFKSFYDGSVTGNNAAVAGLWTSTYKQIYIVNNVIEGLQTSEGVSENIKNRLYGEALSVRGLLHFYLAQTFGDIPYVNTTDYEVNRRIHKTGVAEAVKLAIADLVKAETLVDENYPSSEKVRINKAVVRALLARMYLYTENWFLARQYAEMVMDEPSYDLESLENVFLKQSRSAIWQLKPELDGRNTAEAESYIFEALPPKYIRASLFLTGSFESGDLRKDMWLHFVGGTENAHAYKYKVKGNSTPSKEYSVIIRLEEIYLIAAEASGELGDMEKCTALLNSLRNRAGLASISVTNNTDAVNAVLKERKAELFCEFGHRFYDLKRRNRLDDLLSSKPFWKEHFKRLPLPENELSLNRNLLPQNPGY